MAEQVTRLRREPPPTLRVEKRLLREGHLLIAACDEVGRGALAGPATVGVILVDVSVRRPLTGLRDSKLLTPEAREALVPRIRRWAVGHAVGHAGATEVDGLGILCALRLAGRRALASLPACPDVVLLDGGFDYLSPPVQPGLVDVEPMFPELTGPPVVTVVKADLRCASVAGASVLAKTARDRIMVEMAAVYPGYGWEDNKGYATPEHLDALRRLGPCHQHRCSWRLPERVPTAVTGSLLEVTAPVVEAGRGGVGLLDDLPA